MDIKSVDKLLCIYPGGHCLRHNRRSDIGHYITSCGERAAGPSAYANEGCMMEGTKYSRLGVQSSSVRAAKLHQICLMCGLPIQVSA